MILFLKKEVFVIGLIVLFWCTSLAYFTYSILFIFLCLLCFLVGLSITNSVILSIGVYISLDLLPKYTCSLTGGVSSLLLIVDTKEPFLNSPLSSLVPSNISPSPFGLSLSHYPL